jgi:hypothetical protein
MELQVANNIVCDINTYYSNNSIYKSLIICNNDSDVNTLSKLMKEELYSVYALTLDDLDDLDYYYNLGNRIPLYIKNLITFSSQKYRVIIISYNIWLKLNKELETYILPEQNLIILNLLKEVYAKEVLDWIFDTLNRGFITRPDSYVLNLMYTNENTCYNQQVLQLTNSSERRNIHTHFKHTPEYVF